MTCERGHFYLSKTNRNYQDLKLLNLEKLKSSTSDQVFNGTIVNHALPFLYGELFESMLNSIKLMFVVGPQIVKIYYF